MKIKLVLGKTESDNVSVAWTAIKIIEVELPIKKKDGWHLMGAQWPDDEQIPTSE